jgi:hypothetical protein
MPATGFSNFRSRGAAFVSGSHILSQSDSSEFQTLLAARRLAVTYLPYPPYLVHPPLVTALAPRA